VLNRNDYRSSHIRSQDASHYDNDVFALGTYDSWIWGQEQEVLESICAGQSIRTHLDFACGTGRLLTWASKKNFDSVGIDISQAMLDRARQRRNLNARLIHGDLTEANLLAGCKFDLITAFRFFTNAEPQLKDKALSALLPLCSASGALVVNLHLNPTSLHAVTRLGRRHTGDRPPGLALRAFTPFAEACGWRVSEVQGVGLLPRSLFKIVGEDVASSLDALARRTHITDKSVDLILTLRPASPERARASENGSHCEDDRYRPR